MRFGSIIDVQVNWYTAGSAMSHKQEGYAFLRFANVDSFHAVLSNPNYIVDGITLICTQSNGGTGVGYRYGARKGPATMTALGHAHTPRVPALHIPTAVHPNQRNIPYDSRHSFLNTDVSTTGKYSLFGDITPRLY